MSNSKTILITILACAITLWGLISLRFDHELQTGGALLALFVVNACAIWILVRPSVSNHPKVVGGLADVLEELGKELAEARNRNRPADTIFWQSAELELSVLVEDSGRGKMAFKVASGEITSGTTRTSKLSISLHPEYGDGVGM